MKVKGEGQTHCNSFSSNVTECSISEQRADGSVDIRNEAACYQCVRANDLPCHRMHGRSICISGRCGSPSHSLLSTPSEHWYTAWSQRPACSEDMWRYDPSRQLYFLVLETVVVVKNTYTGEKTDKKISVQPIELKVREECGKLRKSTAWRNDCCGQPMAYQTSPTDSCYVNALSSRSCRQRIHYHYYCYCY